MSRPALEQIVGGHTERLGNLNKPSSLRSRLAGFPVRHRGLINVEPQCQVTLAQVRGLPQ